MRLVATIPLEQLRTSLEALKLDLPQFTLVSTTTALKIYKQVR